MTTRENAKTFRGRGGSGRGYTRGRGRGRGGSARGLGMGAHPAGPPPVHEQGAPRLDPLGDIIDSINIKTLMVDNDSPKIQDVEYVASHNWVNGTAPKILVPGSPPAWTPPVDDVKLVPDERKAFRDLNAARWPSFPLEPTVRAIEAMSPDFDLASVDIVACSHTLSHLVDVVVLRGDPFRFDVDLIGDTVFFTRKGASPMELLNLRGYGFRFPELYTTWDTDVKESVSHQRAIHYTFGGLNILLRYGASAYVPDQRTRSKLLQDLSLQNGRPLEDAMEQLFVKAKYTAPLPKKQTLQVELRGTNIPQAITLDIKTRSVHNKLDMSTVLPRLWMSQTPKFVCAYHEYGNFKKPGVEDLTDAVRKWETDNASPLARFHALVKRIIDTVRDAASQQCEVFYDGKGDVLVTEQVAPHRRALPDDLHHLFDDSGGCAI